MAEKQKNIPHGLDIILTKPLWFKYRITTIFYNQFNEEYAEGEENAFTLKEAITVINNNIFWAKSHKNIKRDCIHVINNTKKYININ